MALLVFKEKRESFFSFWAIELLVFSGLFFTLCLSVSSGLTVKADQVRAAFIYNLTSFIKWSNAYEQNTDNQFLIVVLGDREVARNLELLTEGDELKGRFFKIRYTRFPGDVNYCNVLYADKSVADQLSTEFLKRLNDHQVLTIGDSFSFLKKGGIVALIQAEKRIKIFINMTAAKQAGLSFNAQLLKVAGIFSEKEGGVR